MEDVIKEYFISLPTEIPCVELLDLISLKSDKDLKIEIEACVKKITDSLYLSYYCNTLSPDHLDPHYDFYELSYDNVIVGFKSVFYEFSFYEFSFIFYKDFLFRIDVTDQKLFSVYYFNSGHMRTVYKSRGFEQPATSFLFRLRGEDEKLHEAKQILGVKGELNEENEEYYFTRFAEKYPILLPESIPGFQQNIGNIFVVKDDHLVGIQELPIEIEYV